LLSSSQVSTSTSSWARISFCTLAVAL
jgi:hypothetical protein